MRGNRKKVYIFVLGTFLCLLLFKTVQYNAIYKSRLAVYNTGIGAFKARIDYIQKLNKLLPEKEQEDNLLELHRIVSQSDIEDLLNARATLDTWNVNIVNDKIEEIKKELARLDIEYDKIYRKLSH
jgi:arginyl-tRNA synthetase